MLNANGDTAGGPVGAAAALDATPAVNAAAGCATLLLSLGTRGLEDPWGLRGFACMDAMHDRGVGSWTAAAPVRESTASSLRRAVKGAAASTEATSARGVEGGSAWKGDDVLAPGRELTNTFASAASA